MNLGSIFSLLVSAGFPKVWLTLELLCTFSERVSCAHSFLGRAVSCARPVWRKGPLELCSPELLPPEEHCKDSQWTSQPENLKQ